MTDQQRPNIIIMYADDLGFGDVSCYGASVLETPNIDRLAERGLRFHQGYATAATCTPSRFSLLTGSYPWRHPRAAILAGDAAGLIDAKTPTMPRMLQRAGYHTAVVGKWHLGLGSGSINWNGEISNTPNDAGFDYSYIMAATNDRVPCVYVKDRHVENLDPADPIEVTYKWEEQFPDVPTGRDNPEQLSLMYSHGHDGTIVNGVSRIGHMRGGKSALWNDEIMAEQFLGEAKQVMQNNSEQPFFLYYAFHQPHVPRLPGPRFKGKSSLGARGDVIMEMDWCVGEILDEVERLGIADNTILIFTSDNGPVLDDGYEDKAAALNGDHKPAGPLRGGKYSLFDGGTRVPFILSWPGSVAAGESTALVSQMDFYASFAAMVQQPMQDSDGPDSVDVMAAFTGADPAGREELVVEGMKQKTVLRQDDWAYIPPYDGPAKNTNTNTELGNSDQVQLYNLGQDVGQMSNIADEHPDVVSCLAERLKDIHSSTQTRWSRRRGQA